MIDWDDPKLHPFYPLDKKIFPYAIEGCYLCGGNAEEHDGDPLEYLDAHEEGKERETETAGFLASIDPRRLLSHHEAVLSQYSREPQPLTWNDVVRLQGESKLNRERAKRCAKEILRRLVNSGRMRIVEKGTYALNKEGEKVE